MANYKKLTDVEVMEEVSENTMALVEDNGKLKKVPCGKGFGGGVTTAIFKANYYEEIIGDMLNGGGGSEVSMASAAPEVSEYTCLNMTFQEAYDLMRSGEPLMGLMMDFYNGAACMPMAMVFVGIEAFTEPCIVIDGYGSSYFWTSTGIWTSPPGGGSIPE
jgi:hypothetical protein